MEGAAQTFAPGQAVNGDRGREAVGDRSKAEAFVSTYAAVSKHVRRKKWDKLTKAELKRLRRAPCTSEDNLARLVQSVQDGWNKPKARGRPVDGVTADKFVLVAYDFARAYDTIDHKMLYAKLLRQLPYCMARWISRLLRDRRACVEVNGVRSRERPFRAGLPQGSVLVPTLYTIWAADLIADLRRAPRTDIFMYADDTSTLSAGATIQTALAAAQHSADLLAKWATRNKMTIASQKTQIMVLSQWSRDAKDTTILVSGTPVRATPTVKLLGVTLDRLLHFGDHCANLKRKARPRINQLRKLTGHSWGLREPHLRAVANGYIRGAIEYAAAAWLPAASRSHLELVDRELRAVARAVTGCPLSTPAHALMAEAGLPTAEMRSATLAARMLARASALPAEDPLRELAEAAVPCRLRNVTGWRDQGRRTLDALGVTASSVEPMVAVPLPPWTSREGISISCAVPSECVRSAGEHARRAAAALLTDLPGAEQATWVWSDGSADGGTVRGGGGALIVLPTGTEHTSWPDGWYRSIFTDQTLPAPVRLDSREAAVDVHQLRAGHWSMSAQYLHRIGRRPTAACPGCADAGCPAARCLVCEEEADTPQHVLLRCPCLCGARFLAMGNIYGRPTDLRRDDVVAALAAGFRSFQSRTTTPR
ncbi:putative RNA-directed DNA polymerase from transposon BS [Amphibalanus amphitrite]|uniref:Putative RNA-directed DNA polymerase from transposon BS n=1 Tax=Amphibalanus amphitrite TaxID=1232801 RepID=A0A6A4WBW0_AMPAM|nr:putative RNA-directed DNA polymerase from transposon BS [Amphibalanus amphitrite]